MRKQNCLTRALDQWNENKDMFRLWYNSGHVISLEPDYEGHDLTILKGYPCPEYLELDKYGYDYFVNAFELSEEYKSILSEYFDNLSSEI